MAILALTATSAVAEDYVPLKEVVASLESGYDVRMGGIVSVDWDAIQYT